ncbi:hypothetical protein HJC23_007925 [Cyclotella cryptica]|uniref:N-acetyltransferase domain-containing protein n=1 Tax=Cyclotella cryptica TaxID=29204 RepID=A0ABD3NYH4_9STRA|eukprot:CCRYP_018779-RA/>CCRYP_018779-RA protein AED:0.06 eAED:0.06 QI:0/-1/0/1/-1/1/1/0/440
MSTSEHKVPGDQPFRYRFVSIDDECNNWQVHSSPDSDSPPCFALLRQFYDDLMIPTFPLEDERDDLDDWFECFRFQMKQSQRASDVQSSHNLTEREKLMLQANAMDVILMILDNSSSTGDEHATEGNQSIPSRQVFDETRRLASFAGLFAPLTEDDASRATKPVIIGGAAVEYYKESRVGLLSYIVLHSDFRARGLAVHLHSEALSRLKRLSTLYSVPMSKSNEDPEVSLAAAPLIQAVFAETNTAAAGDVTPEQSLLRHKALYKLGYRLVNFPYAQPPLSTEDVDGSFDDLLLLVYFPFCEDDVSESKDIMDEKVTDHKATDDAELILSKDEAHTLYPWYRRQSNLVPRMNVDIPFCFVEDFYKSVFGYNSSSESPVNREVVEGIPDYRTAKFFQLAHWFSRNRENSGSVDVNLCGPPWEDCKDRLYTEFFEWQRTRQN